MRNIKNILLAFLAGCSLHGICQTKSGENLLLIHSNEPIQFDKVNAVVISDAVKEIMRVSDIRVKKIIAGMKPGGGAGSTLVEYDLLSYDLNDLAMKLGLIAETFESDSSRDAANDGSQTLSNYWTSLILNKELYIAIKKFADQSLKNLKPNEQKFVTEQVRIFENNGMKLDSNDRKKLQIISDRLTGLGLEFDKNIATSRDSIIYTSSDLAGIPENVKKTWEISPGQYLIYINTPNLISILDNADVDSTRQNMMYKYKNRAYPENIKVLDSLLFYRYKYARLLGYKSFAAYALTDKMASYPKMVWDFENNLIEKLTPAENNDLASIRKIKHAMHPEQPDTIYTWDINYYKNKLLKSAYQLNPEEVREYFEMNQTISGLFEVYHQLFGISVRETRGLPVWYKKVRSFDMYLGEKKIGRFYFDLYPRKNKFTHFACFPVSQASQFNGKEVLPVAALICNFPEGAKGDPTLLDHSDVITLFHEFGHLVLHMLVRSNLASQPETMKPDFVEAPSQFLENFCWQYASLKIFAKNYKTGAVLPESLFKKMKASEHVLDAMYYMRQLYLGLIDFTFEDRYDSIKGMDLSSVSDNLWSIMHIPVQKGAHDIASFGHLNSYAANYYGYLWSRVFAEDIFSAFEKNGVMDPKTGMRYRKQILEVAGSVQEMDMLRNFLGREPNGDAFMKSLGL